MNALGCGGSGGAIGGAVHDRWRFGGWWLFRVRL
jgi:hypothetical protein